jgi:hypothetical protein
LWCLYQDGRRGLAGDEAVGILTGEQTLALLERGQGRTDQQAIDARDNDAGRASSVDQLARLVEADGDADSPFRYERAQGMKAKAELVLNPHPSFVDEIGEQPGTVLLR